MSDVYPVLPVVRFCGVTARYAATRQWAIEQLTRHWGHPIRRSAALPFPAHGYYEDEMGGPLHQELVGFESTLPPDGLPEWKLATNELEKAAAAEGLDEIPRPVNLDCGYVTEAKFVLATTKNRSHRVYLRDGIYAEITLTYVGGRWRFHDQTYENYRTDEVAEFASALRTHLRNQLGKVS